MIHSLYEYQKDASTKSKYILRQYSAIYEPLHVKSKSIDQIPLYVCPPPPHIKARLERKPSLCLVNARQQYLSGLYFPQVENPGLGYGDILGKDAVLGSMKNNGALEVIVFTGSKHLCMALFTMFADGDLDMLAELETHRRALKKWLPEKPESLT